MYLKHYKLGIFDRFVRRLTASRVRIRNRNEFNYSVFLFAILSVIILNIVYIVWQMIFWINL